MVIGAKELVEQGNASLRQGCHEQALRHYEKALVLAPDHPGILNNYAAVLERLDRLDEAFRVYERLQARSPPHAGVLANGAVVLMKLQRLDEALARIEQALSLAPQYAEAFNIRGNVLFRLRRLPQALESYDRADSLRPGHPTSLVNRAFVLQALKRYKDADLAFVELLRRQLPFPGGRQHVLNNRLRSCDWTDYAALLAEVVRDIENGQAALRKMFVAERCRGPSVRVGAKLLESLLIHARQKHLKSIYLGTTEQFVAAHRFYEKNGFVPIDVRSLPPTFPLMAVDTRFYRLQLA